MRQTISMFALLVLLVSAGTATAQTIDAGRGTLPLYVPSTYDAETPTPLIVLLHGYSSSGEGQNTYMGISPLVDTYGFILVSPDGTKEASDAENHFWNASSACCNFFDSDVNDVAYLAGLIDAVKDAYTIDEKRVYLIGHSNGGFMSYRMAHEHSGTIAAIASLAGADQTQPRPAPPNPVHVLQIHGTADTAITYEGGEFRGGGHPGAKESVGNWSAHNGCAATGLDAGTVDLDGGLEGAETDITRYTSGCNNGGSAELWTINGGGHVPAFSTHFSPLVIEWLLGHPKP